MFIEPELTREEVEIQQKLKEKAKGNDVLVGYKKIKINNRWVNSGEIREKFKATKKIKR